MKTILVALESCDTTTVESPIVKKTVELARAFASRVWLLHVVPPSREPPFNIDSTVARHEIAAELHDEHDYLQHLARCVERQDVKVHALLVQGSIISTIVRESERLDADLVILGCHKHGRLYTALMDSTEEGLLTRCERPIMFIPC